MSQPQKIKKIRVGRYLIDGCPVAVTRTHFGDGRCWDNQKRIKVVNSITLQSQHNDKPLFEGPLSLNISFYLPISSGKKFALNTKPHTQAPEIENLIKYFINIASGIIYKHDNTIASVVARKYYSTNPRTEIIVSEIEEDTW